MEKFELIDDYVTNKLEKSELESFEKAILSDKELKAEVDFQKSLIEGIKQYRNFELKAKLKNVKVSTSIWAPRPLIFGGLSLVATLLIIYFFASKPPTPTATLTEQKLDSTAIVQKNETPTKKLDSESHTVKKVVENQKISIAKEKAKVGIINLQAQKPTLKLADPLSDTTQVVEPKIEEPVTVNKFENTIKPKTEVIVDNSQKKYNFHYQSKNGKISLFGPFDKNLYELLEIYGIDKTLFLYFKDKFYLLDMNQSEITKLVPIKDESLLKKLQGYREK